MNWTVLQKSHHSARIPADVTGGQNDQGIIVVGGADRRPYQAWGVLLGPALDRTVGSVQDPLAAAAFQACWLWRIHFVIQLSLRHADHYTSHFLKLQITYKNFDETLNQVYQAGKTAYTAICQPSSLKVLS